MWNGILNIYKEKGYTSHDVVAKLRGIVQQRKIGHTGTLDPDAEGVLPVCLGKATRLCDMLIDTSKTYEAVLLLGTTTDTQDITGQVLEKKETGYLTEEEVRACIAGYTGEYEQLPPMYSALKVNGKKLYELARQGIEVERKTRKVMIYDIYIEEIVLPRVRMKVHCSKGTYIRTLCHDIGMKLKCGGCMESLLRTQVGCFELKNSLKLKEIEEACADGNLEQFLLPVDAVFQELKEARVLREHQALAYNGNRLPEKFMEKNPEAPDGFFHEERVRVYDMERHFIGIFRYDEEKRELRVEKMFLNREAED